MNPFDRGQVLRELDKRLDEHNNLISRLTERVKQLTFWQSVKGFYYFCCCDDIKIPNEYTIADVQYRLNTLIDFRKYVLDSTSDSVMLTFPQYKWIFYDPHLEYLIYLNEPIQ